MRSPRTPGGSHVPVTVSRNAAATTAQHSPTILAQSGYGTRQDPFASPLGRHEGGGGGGGAGSVPRKIAFDFFSPTAEPAPLPGDTKVSRMQVEWEREQGSGAVVVEHGGGEGWLRGPDGTACMCAVAAPFASADAHQITERLPFEAQGGAREAAGEPRGLVHHGANVQAVEPEGQTLSVLSDRKRGGSFSGVG